MKKPSPWSREVYAFACVHCRTPYRIKADRCTRKWEEFDFFDGSCPGCGDQFQIVSIQHEDPRKEEVKPTVPSPLRERRRRIV